jgi:hypothetical protein
MRHRGPAALVSRTSRPNSKVRRRSNPFPYRIIDIHDCVAIYDENQRDKQPD